MERAIVSAAAGVMSSVLGKLADLLHEEYKLAKGVRKDIEFLRSELSAMNDLLYVLAEVEELDAINKLGVARQGAGAGLRHRGLH